MVALGGFRVGRMLVAAGLPPQGAALRSNVFERLAARWHSRRFTPHLALELRGDGGSSHGAAASRPQAGPERVILPTPNVPLGQQHGEPA
jgi:hypothetical protein